MDKSISVLVFPCGAENALEIHLALKDVLNIKLFGASGKDDHGSYVFKNYIGSMPYINSNNFIDRLNEVIVENSIDIVIPTHDDVVLKLAEASNIIKAKIAIPGLEQSVICRSKKKTYQLFKDYSFCPRIYSQIEEINEFPIFVKPDAGQGSKGSIKIDRNNINQLNNQVLEDYVLCEFLPGEEITVDCFTDKKGLLRFVGPRKRERVFSGISVRSFIIPLTDEIESVAKIISSKIQMNGLWYFQLKKDINNSYKLLEISVRVAGTMNLYRGLGVNFPLLTIYNLLGYNIDIIRNYNYLEVDRSLFNRYKHNIDFEKVYIDFDDTIIKKEVVNPEVMFFIYNAKNNHKSIHLITKHEYNLDDTLERLKIHKGLFDEIIHLKKTESKYQFINDFAKSIFIDNAFSERLQVKNQLSIPVFDVDAIPTLINWKN
jgi:hypothetical protein